MRKLCLQLQLERCLHPELELLLPLRLQPLLQMRRVRRRVAYSPGPLEEVGFLDGSWVASCRRWDHGQMLCSTRACHCGQMASLHSAASTPILHRDIKSSNVSLDDNLTAKLSDFGASKYIPIDQNGVTTAVQGTIGYLDFIYHYEGRLTNKSDVYSFGILVKLITRKKPSVYRSSDGESIASHFSSLLADGNLVDIIDPQIKEEGGGQVHEAAELAGMCTILNGEDWSTTREVEVALES